MKDRSAQAEHAHIESLLGAYVLDGVDDDERVLVDDHLPTCPRCRAEVRDHREVAALFARTGAPAPDGVWDRIAGAIGGPASPALRLIVADPAPAAVPPAATGWRRIARSAVAVAAAVAIIGLSVATVRMQNRLDERDRETTLAVAATEALGSPDARRTELVADDGSVLAVAAVLPDGQGYLLAEGLPELDERIYQLWAINGDDLVSLGVFGSDDAVVAFHTGATTNGLAVTAEDAPVVQSANTPVGAGPLA